MTCSPASLGHHLLSQRLPCSNRCAFRDKPWQSRGQTKPHTSDASSKPATFDEDKRRAAAVLEQQQQRRRQRHGSAGSTHGPGGVLDVFGGMLEGVNTLGRSVLTGTSEVFGGAFDGALSALHVPMKSNPLGRKLIDVEEVGFTPYGGITCKWHMSMRRMPHATCHLL